MKRVTKVLILAILAIVLFASPAYADTANPDSPPIMEELNIYTWVIEENDWLVLIYANIPYVTPPSTPVTQTFIWRFMGSDNVTVLASTVGYAYNDDGYGYNVYSMYLSAADAAGMTFGGGVNYTIRLSGNPAVFDTPPVYNFPIAAGDYSAMTTKADTQAELAARILSIADDLFSKWSLTAITTLLTQNETATVLSIFGEAFFRGAIYGVQAMAPSIFSVIIREIDIEPRDWSDNYTEALVDQPSGWIETSQEAGKALFGTDWDLLSLIIILGMCGGLMVGNVMITGDFWNGCVDCGLVAVIGARLGMYDLALLILAAAMIVFYISAKVWFGFFKS